MNRPIALITDFGQSDWFVASMKGAILSVNPAAVIVDGVPGVGVARTSRALGGFTGPIPKSHSQPESWSHNQRPANTL